MKETVVQQYRRLAELDRMVADKTGPFPLVRKRYIESAARWDEIADRYEGFDRLERR